LQLFRVEIAITRIIAKVYSWRGEESEGMCKDKEEKSDDDVVYVFSAEKMQKLLVAYLELNVFVFLFTSWGPSHRPGFSII